MQFLSVMCVLHYQQDKQTIMIISLIYNNILSIDWTKKIEIFILFSEIIILIL